MRKLAFVAILLLVGMLPLAASAQQRPPSSPVVPPTGEVVVNVSKLVAIGAGVVIGAVVLEALALGDAAVLAGGIAGGFLGAWWYDGQDGMSRTIIRQPVGLSMASTGERAIPSF